MSNISSTLLSIRSLAPEDLRDVVETSKKCIEEQYAELLEKHDMELREFQTRFETLKEDHAVELNKMYDTINYLADTSLSAHTRSYDLHAISKQDLKILLDQNETFRKVMCILIILFLTFVLFPYI